MMKRRSIGIFGKTFIYTLTLIIIILIIAVAFFANQFVQFYATTRENQITETMQSLVQQLNGKSKEEAVKAAGEFAEKNPTVDFSLLDSSGKALYASPSCSVSFFVKDGKIAVNNVPVDKTNEEEDTSSVQMRVISVPLADEEVELAVTYNYSDKEAYSAFFKMLPVVLLAVFLVSALGAAGYAKVMTQPIRRLAMDTRQMSEMKLVPVPPIRNDEIGQLTTDVHNLYNSLRTTISDLETEMERVRQMEESQRYFFSAASHELKTPIAATEALLEGMLENIGDYKDHPKYLNECLKMMNSLNKLVAEILELVRLTDGKILTQYEEVHLDHMIKAILSTYQTLADVKNQVLTVQIPPNQICCADSKMLERALCNVIMNAVQNTPENGVITIWSEECDSDIKLCILNQGHIDENAITKVCEPFYRLDTARSRKDGHSGLGLVIVKKLLESMQIPFNLSNTDKGVLFCMEIPKSK
jgi:two-component system, OmpR family, sensor histidine kinase VanS